MPHRNCIHCATVEQVEGSFWICTNPKSEFYTQQVPNPWRACCNLFVSKATTNANDLSKPQFPPDLECLLEIEDAGKFWYIRPLIWLGNENFIRVLNIVKECGGKYVSKRECAQPHFEVPKSGRTASRNTDEGSKLG